MSQTAARASVVPLALALLALVAGAAQSGHAATLDSERAPTTNPTSTFGTTEKGRPKPLPANTKRVSAYMLAEAGTLTHLRAYIDGRGRGKGTQQRLRLVVYSDKSGRPATLLGVTKEHRVSKGAGGRWVSLALTKPVELAAGHYHLGIHSGASGRVARYGVVRRQTARRQNRNGYRAGPTRLFGRAQKYSESIAINGQARDKKAPTAPLGLTVTEATTTSLTLEWTASKDNVGVAGYWLYRNGVRVATTLGSNHVFGDLACGTTNTLGVEAFDAAGNVSKRSSVSSTTPACAPPPLPPAPDTEPPSVPQGLTMTGATASSITLAWNASTDNVGVAGYRLYRNGSAVGTTTLVTYAFAGLACDTTYTLALEAFDAAGNVSNKAEATTIRSTTSCSPPPPSPPPPSPATAANLWVDTNGGSCTRSVSPAAYDDAATCGSFDAANDVCRDGDLVLVRGGTYPAQSVSGSNGRVAYCTLRVASGETAMLTGNFTLSAAAHLDIGGFTAQGGVNFSWNAISSNIVVRDVTAFRFLIQGARNVTLTGGSYGDFNGVDDPGTFDNYQNSKIEEYYTARPDGVTIDGVTLHDFYCLPADCHAECLFIYKASNVTVKNSRFYNCDFYNIFFAGGNDDNVLIENNWFGQPYIPNTNGTTRNPSYGRATGLQWKSGSYSNHHIRFNSFHPGTGAAFDGTGAFATLVGNVMRRNLCGTGATYRYNIMDATCNATDTATSTFGYENTSPGRDFDPHLVAGARPIDAVPTSVLGGCPSTDGGGSNRPLGLGCDAGAHERE